jgi:hypothetical protein
MNEADASPGSGAASDSSASSAPQASGASANAQPPATTAPDPGMVKAIADAVAGSVGTSVKDTVFAELRRTGVLKGSTPKPQATTTAAADPASSPNPTIDATAGRRLDRALNRLGFAAHLDDRAYQRVERDFAADSPTDPEAWVREYYGSMGVKPTPQQAANGAASSGAQPATPAAPAAATPAAAAAQPTTPQAQQPPAAAPSAPNGNAMPMTHGVVDIFSLQPHELKALGPDGVRKSLDALVKIGRQLQGAPSRPKVPTRQ